MSSDSNFLEGSGTCPKSGSTSQSSENKSSNLEVPDNKTRHGISAAQQVPVEVLQQIYQSLKPKDFNSARHTCRGWMRGSLDEQLLLSMLSRIGWTCWDYETQRQKGAWSLSKSLARECALSSDWTGNGVDKIPLFTETSNINFSELDLKHGFRSRQSGLVLITSICGDYLLAARDRRIFVYRLRSHSLAPVTSIVCPRRVLSMSMDGSSGRPVVAALLEERMGLVCELRCGEVGDESAVDSNGNDDEGNTVESSPSTNSDDGSQGILHLGRDMVESFFEINLRSDNGSARIRGLWNNERHDSNLIYQTWPLKIRGILKDSTTETCTRRLRVENSKCTIYRRLCLQDDPPRSVSICPDHRCVAFGSSCGVELHWVDAATGQNLCRWFTLTLPSDHVHFIQPRLGFESAWKLRLTSSATPIPSRTYLGGRIVSAHRLCSDTRSVEHDHYHAVPLSDGHHILFLDPVTKVLTLGCDEKTGGSVKLARKMQLIPPYKSAMPSVYTSAFDMSWGARIVAAYGDTITLYNVPPDVLDFSCFEHETATSCRSIILGRQARREWLEWRDDDSEKDSLWPLAFRGTEVGKLEGVCALAVQSVPGVTVWAFSRTAQCKSWRAGGCDGAAEREEGFVCRSGFVHDVYDKHDEGHGQSSQRATMADTRGGASGELRWLPRALAAEKDGAVEEVDVRGYLDAWYNEDGDVVTCGKAEHEEESESEFGYNDGAVWSEDEQRE